MGNALRDYSKYRILESAEIIGKTSAGTPHHIMGATFAGFVGLFLKYMAEKSGVHFSDGKLIDLFEVLDIPQFLIVKGEAVETIPFRINIHRAVIGTAKINIFIFPFSDTGNRLTPVVEKTLDKGILIFLNFI